MTKIIGLTGGIGSGKSTIAAYFKQKGIPVYIADERAKLISEKPKIVNQILAVFGNEILDNNQISKQKLSTVVFSNKEKLKLLNAIIHPEVKKDFELWVQEQKTPFVIKEAAILFESGSYKNCDFVITVTAPIEERIKRVLARDQTTRDLVLNRMANQWTDEQRIEKSDFVIENNSLETAYNQADKILNLLKYQ